MSQSAITAFERHLRAQGKRPGTIDSYTTIVRRFFADQAVPPEAITADHAYDWLVDRGNALGLSASWFNVLFHAVVGWLTSRGLPTDLRGLRPKRIALQPPRWLTADETRRLLEGLPQRPFRTVALTMLATGMRVSEALAIRVDDIDRERALIRVRCGKGGDGRLVSCSPRLRGILRDFWRVGHPRGFLFQRDQGGADEPMQAATFNAALRRAAERGSFTERVSSHRLRHTFAIHSLQGGMDVVQLGRLMGHRSLQSTLRYVTPDLERASTPVDVLARLGVRP